MLFGSHFGNECLRLSSMCVQSVVQICVLEFFLWWCKVYNFTTSSWWATLPIAIATVGKFHENFFCLPSIIFFFNYAQPAGPGTRVPAIRVKFYYTGTAGGLTAIKPREVPPERSVTIKYLLPNGIQLINRELT